MSICSMVAITVNLTQHVPKTKGKSRPGYSLLEAFTELWRPAVVLGLGGKFPLLVTEMRADDVDFHEGPEALCLPFQVVSNHHWMIKVG